MYTHCTWGIGDIVHVRLCPPPSLLPLSHTHTHTYTHTHTQTCTVMSLSSGGVVNMAASAPSIFPVSPRATTRLSRQALATLESSAERGPLPAGGGSTTICISRSKRASSEREGCMYGRCAWQVCMSCKRL